jgi:hypothetical protein
MLRSLLCTTLIATAVLASAPVFAAPLNELKSPNADMPTSTTMLPDGPGSEQTNSYCLACHSADHILNQPSLTRANWQEVVEKMIKAYKAPIPPDDAAKIVDYLTHLKGKS